MKIKYIAINPEGGSIESFNRDDLPQDWEIIEVEVEDNNQELEELKKLKIEEVDNYYTSMIFTMSAKHFENYIYDGTPIPQEIRDRRDLMREECNQKIQEINSSIVAKPGNPSIQKSK